MDLLIDISGVTFQVSQEVKEKLDGEKKQRRDKDGAPMWTVQVFAQDSKGGEVINITLAGQKPAVKVGQLVVPVGLQALPWNQEKRHGVAFRATELRNPPAASKQAA